MRRVILKYAFTAILNIAGFSYVLAQVPNDHSVKWHKDTIMLYRNDIADSTMARISCHDKLRTNMVVLEWPAGAEQAVWLQMVTYTSPRSAEGMILWGQGRFLRFPLHADPHATTPGVTFMPVFPGIAIDVINIRGTFPPGTDSLQVYLWQFDIPPVPPLSTPVSARGQCASPPVISQQLWRAGLNPPVPGRSATPTHHCIVHHSAGNTHDTDFTRVVRGYYVYHTTVNGWDDIGYNYLVAPNGDVYAGRDPEKAGIRQDNVLGAHFCGKNTNTMGVCVIGDYTTEEPSAKAMASLTDLLGWKVALDTINPMGNINHPWPAGSLLPVVAGHRDGCATECPGNRLYARLSGLRNDLLPCFPAVSADRTASSSLQILPVSGGFMLGGTGLAMTAQVFDPAGRMVWSGELKSGETVRLPDAGVYQLLLQTTDGRVFRQRFFRP